MSLSLNARRKFKDTPAGSIPVEWGCAPLNSLVQKPQYGTSVGLGSTGRHPVLRMNAIRDGRIIDEDLSFANLDEREAPALELKKGDLLFNRTNSFEKVGQVGIYQLEGYHAFASYLVRLSPRRNLVQPEFLAYTFCASSVDTKVKQLRSKGVSQSNINPTLLVSTVHIPLPEIEEQRAIAGVLGDWDEAIRLHEDRLASLTERKRGLMQRLLTGCTRLPGFEGKSVRMRHNHYFSAPSDWRHCHIHDIADEHTERNHGQQNIPVLSCTKHEGLVESLKYFGKQVFSDNTATYKVVPRNHFAYATNHIEEGSIGYQSEWDAALISPIYSVFKTRDGVHDAFLLHLVKSELYRKIFKACTNASVDRRGSLRWRDFSLIPVALPSVAEQRAIAAVLTACDEEIALTRAAADSLREQKRGLLQTLMTGRLRVPVKATKSHE